MLKVFAPAKVNLFLDVLKKRDDGYHDVKTVLQAVELYDILTIEESKKICVQTSPIHIPEEKNLAYKAAHSLAERLNLNKGAKISIRKRIPLASGLGGGSADAAATVLGLQRLWKKELPYNQMHTICANLGSDVPFFLQGGAALGQDRGTSLASLPFCKFYVVIVDLGFPLPSAFAYKQLKLGLTVKEKKIKMMLSAIENKDIRGIASALYNKLEERIQILYPQIKRAKDALRQAGAYGALMSGSGPSVFGIVESKGEALKIKRKLKSLSYNVMVASTIEGGVRVKEHLGCGQAVRHRTLDPGSEVRILPPQ